MSQASPPPPPPPAGPPAPPWGPPPPPAAPWGQPPPWGWQAQPTLPGSGRFRAQAVGELLDSAFTLYRRNLRLILSIAAIVQLPLALVSFLAYELTGISGTTARIQQLTGGTTLTPRQATDLLGSVAPAFVVLLVIALLQGLVVQPIATAAMTRAVSDLYLDRPAGVGPSYAAVAQRFWAVLGVALLLFAVGVGLFAGAFGIVVLAVLVLGPGGVAILVVVLPGAVVAAVIMYTRWLFAAVVVMLERAGPVNALRRSWRLVRGSTPRVFGITLLVGIITAILSAIVTALLSIATQVGDVTVRLVLSQLASLIVSVLVQPISFIVVVLVYYDLRIRREAFDIEMLASSL